MLVHNNMIEEVYKIPLDMFEPREIYRAQHN